MLKSSAPIQYVIPWANSGTKNTIPVASQIGITNGAASFTDGYPPLTFTPIASGGVPPFGADTNGILYDETLNTLWRQSGFLYAYNSTFSTNQGGYPANAVLMRSDGKGLWLNLADSNTTNPDTANPANWTSIRANLGSTTIAVANGNNTPDPSVLGPRLLIITGSITTTASLILPLTSGSAWVIYNNTSGAGSLSAQGATGSGVTIAQGTVSEVITDGTNFYTSTFNGSGVYLPINGTAVAATKLATARTIAMTGDVSWTSPAFDGTANVTAAGTIQSGAVTLAKMASFQANSLMGNPTGSAATPSAITLQNGLLFSGSNLGMGNITPTTVTTSGNIQANAGQLILNTTTAGDRYVYAYTNNVARWRFGGTADAESGSNSGTNWSLVSFTDAGSFLATPIAVNRASGVATFSTRPIFGTATPWDSANVTPLDKNTGGTVSAPVSIVGTGTSMLTLSSNNTSFTLATIANTSTSGRQWYVGTTGSANSIGSVGTFFIYDGTSSTARLQIDASGNASITGTLTVSSTVTASGYNTSSDETIKSGIRKVAPRDLTSSSLISWDALRDVPVNGRGTSAQSMQKVAPEYVDLALDGTLGVDYGRAALEQAWFNREEIRSIKAHLGMVD